MSTKNFNIKIVIPENVQVNIEDYTLKVKGPKGEVEKRLHNPLVKIEKAEKEVILSTKRQSKKEKKVINTFRSHVNNLINGVTEPYIYKLKICSSHFPITVAVEKDKLIIKNFMGEKIPRKAKILPSVTVKIQGDVVTVESPNKELAGQTAANIEKSCKRSGFDKRVFSDGIWMFYKAGKDIE